MATYPGMSLTGEVRESISLDEDDLSDVEDEVFIRDGKNSYKLAEELNVSMPLMYPRRRIGKPHPMSRHKSKPPCRAFWKPCCYISAALTILIGLIVLVVVLVSIFPLPLDRLRDWIIAKSRPAKSPIKLLPCSNLRVSDVWTTRLPILTSDSPVRLLDLDGDGADDIIFGFGTGGNYDVLPPEIFCPTFVGVAPPCEGGVIALNGTTGDIAWRFWSNEAIFGLQCSADLNSDGFNDCLAVGYEGSIIAINSRNGSVLWHRNTTKYELFEADFVPDQNNDSVADVLAAHTSEISGEGHLVVLSGKTGQEIGRVRIQSKTYFLPQLLPGNTSNFIVFGTGSPTTPGNLSVASLECIISGNFSYRTIYTDLHKGVLTQAVLVDITGDNVLDIVTAMFNSTVVAINGLTLSQIWNYTISNSESDVVPTPGYFNDDNVTDFLIIYEKYDNILNYNYTKTFIIDGKTGKPIYEKSISGSVATQMNALTLSTESHGFDMFVFWTTECTNVEIYNLVNVQEVKQSISDVCRQQFNTTSIMKLNALNQYDQPPGLEVYNSGNRTRLEFNTTKSPLRLIKDYISKHPKIKVSSEGQSEIDEGYVGDSQNIKVHKYGASSFRHKDDRQGIVKDYTGNDNQRISNQEVNDDLDAKYDTDDDYQLQNNPMDDDLEYDSENPKRKLYIPQFKTNRDPRSKPASIAPKSKKKNLSDPKYGIYDYPNIKMARNRLLHDLSNLPWEILRDTYFKNRENQLRKSKFEQRDISSHIDKIKENEDVKRIIDKEKKAAQNASYNLWDLESEKEMQDKENGYWRGKREVDYTSGAVGKITSVGAVINPHNTSSNTIDVVFVTYWQPTGSDSDMFERELEECLEEKLTNDRAHVYTKNTEKEQKELYVDECMREQETLKREFDFSRINRLNLGQMTVYRLRIECVCDAQHLDERCAKFLPQDKQAWSMYLGKLGNGRFQTRN